MPDVRGSVRVTAGVGNSLSARVGGTTPAVLRPSSVASVFQPVGMSAPQHAPGSGAFLLATTPAVPSTVVAAVPYDVGELDRLQQRQFTGGRPSGFGEAVNQLRESYRNRERSAAEDARRAARAALAAQEAALARYNEFAARNGLPTLELPSDVLAELVDNEGHSIGDVSGTGGLQVGAEVAPAWRSDP